MKFSGKAKRLKQAKEEAQDEIEKYRQERERQFKEFEAKVCTKFSRFCLWIYIFANTELMKTRDKTYKYLSLLLALTQC